LGEEDSIVVVLIRELFKRTTTVPSQSVFVEQYLGRFDSGSVALG